MAAKESGFSGWLQRVRRTGEFSDVTVVVDGQEFLLHMLPLLNASSYFRNLPSSSRGHQVVEDSTTVVELRDIVGGPAAFSVAADFCYLIRPIYTLENVAKIRAVASYLGMTELLDSTKKFLYTNVFSHSRSSMAFLQQHKKVNSPVDDYIESRCLKVISAACTKAFFDTKYLSAPVALGSNGSSNTWQSSPCQVLTNTLVRIAALPDHYVEHIVEGLVQAEVNLNLKCRQGRNVKSWLDSTVTTECRTDRARFWVLICLTSMLEKSANLERPWLELASQYWCGLLEHVGLLMKRSDKKLLGKLQTARAFLEQRIGASLHELDDYLESYSFDAGTVLSLVRHFREAAKEVGEKEIEEVASEVNACVVNFVDCASMTPDQFISMVEAFPETAHRSHDLLYTTIEKLVAQTNGLLAATQQNLWGLVDIAKLNEPYNEKALNNPVFLCQPRVLEFVLQRHSDELSNIGVEDRQTLREIMQKVIQASLKLLEENSRRSQEIMELQKQYAALMSAKIGDLSEHTSAILSNPDASINPRLNHSCDHAILPDEVEEAPSETPARRSTSSSLE